MTLDEVIRSVENAGLAYRGAFHPQPEEMPEGAPVGTLVMLGFVGAGQWDRFAASPEKNDGAPHPLDRWSYRVISALGGDLGGTPLFPFTGPPFMPFIKWAQRAESVRPSAIGMLIHPDYGLWHAWRGALAFSEKFELPPADARPTPCKTCVEKPCLSACPVNAYQPDGYNVAACGGHIRRPEGGDCMGGGCRARRACPVGKELQYGPDQAAFHMRSFRGG